MFKGGLGFDLAQKIVDNIMTIVPYNINIMDKSGTIIASGNPNRINKLHLGAIHALEKQEPYCIYEDTEFEKKGINVPFRYRDEIVGVIGVSGEPEKVEEIANIVRVTAELMIDKQIYDNKAFARETKIRDLFNDIISKPDYQQHPAIKMRAEELDIDLSKSRTAVIFRFKDTSHDQSEVIKQSLISGEHVIKEGTNEVVVIYFSSPLIDKRIEKCIELNTHVDKVFVGLATKNLYQAFSSALDMVRLSEVLSIKDVVMKSENFLLEAFALQLNKTEFHTDLAYRFNEFGKGEMLKETLMTFVRQSFDIHKTCNHLFIHKNTLYYRLQKVSDFTGYDIKNPKDALILYMILVNSSL